jgi:hypothetical protein
MSEIREEENHTGKAKWNDARTSLLGTREGRTSATAISGNAAQIPMEEVAARVALPKLISAKYQSERSQP